jgi:hypothetical protein
MTENQITLKAPVWLWKVAVGTSALLAVLEACGIAKVPWFVALLPIALVIGLTLAIVLALAITALIVLGFAAAIDAHDRHSRRKAAQKRAKLNALSNPNDQPWRTKGVK